MAAGWGTAADKVRTGHQSKDGQADWPDDPAECLGQSTLGYPMISDLNIENRKAIPPNVLARADTRGRIQ